MNTRKLWRLAVVAGLVATGLSTAPAGAVVDERTPPPAAASYRAADPAGTKYVYSSTFAATMTYKLYLDFGGGSTQTKNATASLSGTGPTVEITQSGQLRVVAPSPPEATVTSASGTAVTAFAANGLVRTCKASSAAASGAPAARVDEHGFHWLMPYAYLAMPAKCSDNKGGPTSEEQFGFGSLWAAAPYDKYVPGSEAFGHYLYVARGTSPHSFATECPGYMAGPKNTCSYVIQGSVGYRLVKKILPKTPKPKTPKDATISAGATKLGAGVLCKKKCTVTMSVVTLKDGRQVIAPRILRPTPGKVVKVKVTIPASKRALVKKAGGVQMKLTYRLAGGKKYSETRKARL